jgi:hypothetical protein
MKGRLPFKKGFSNQMLLQLPAEAVFIPYVKGIGNGFDFTQRHAVKHAE